MLLLSKEDIKKVFSMKDAIEADKKAFCLCSKGETVVPLRSTIQAADGVFLFMPAYAKDIGYASLKNVNIFGGNLEKGLPTAPAQVLLINGDTGIIEAIIDGTYVTQIRTGAASGTAFDVLAKKVCRKGAVIGTGSQAAAQLEAMLAARELEEVLVYSRNKERTEQFAQQMNEELKAYGAMIKAAATSDEAVADADLIICVTPSEKPVFDASKIKPGATLSCVGSYQPDMQEIDPAVFTKTAKIYFDSKDAVLSESGDILIPLEDGTITEADFTGDIGDVILGNVTGRENEEEIILFKSVGIGAQDLVAAKEIYDKASKQGVGLCWN